MWSYFFGTPDDKYPEMTHFYRSLGKKNQSFRPSIRTYEKALPEGRLHRLFEDALIDFPFKFPKKRPEIWTTSADVEGGMPHTFDNRVIIPLTGKHPSKRTLIHELCHVHQRQCPEVWGELYVKLGFVKVEKPPGILDSDIYIQNPDAGNLGMPAIGWWSYHGQVCALEGTGFDDMSPFCLPVEDVPIEPNMFKKTFSPIVSQWDHPNEITACIISNYWDVVVEKHAIRRSLPSALVKTRLWVDTIISRLNVEHGKRGWF